VELCTTSKNTNPCRRSISATQFPAICYKCDKRENATFGRIKREANFEDGSDV